ncbi:MAG TPA: hypothetical protein VH025_11140, partial [Solirubrobacteraceae bacterium]|nr:hypothetical protein [Solirubrobacteraceae bacterium]
MVRRLPALLCALVPALLVPAASAGAIGAKSQLSETPAADQGSSFHYRSYVRRVTPHSTGLSVQVLEFADRLLLVNHTGKTV